MHEADGQNWFDIALVQAVLKVLLWGYVLCAAASFFAEPVDRFDDAGVLVDAMLIQEGRTPNLDFFSYYPPLGLYLNAAAFDVLGRTVLAVRAIGVALYILLLLWAANLFRSKFPHYRPLVPVAMFFFAASIGNAITLPSWPGFAVSIVALLTYLYSEYGPRDRLWGVGASGVLTGLALLYRINFGAYVAMVVGFDLLLPWCYRDRAPRDRRSLQVDLLRATVFVGSLALCCAAFCFWVYGRHVATAVPDLIVNGQRLILARFNGLPFSLGLASAVALPPLWFFVRILMGADVIPPKALIPAAVAIALLSITRVGRSHPSIVSAVAALEIASVVLLHLFVYRLQKFELSGLLLFCGLLHYYLSRADYPHWRLLPIGAALLVLFLLFSAQGPTESGRGSISKGSAFAVLITATFVCLASIDIRPLAGQIPNGVRLLASVVLHSHRTDADRVLGGTEPQSAWLSVYPDEDELQALRYLRARTSSADAIFVGLPDHSRIDPNYSNDLRIYWLAGRKIGVRTFQLEPGMATEAWGQRELMADLEQNNVKWVVIESISWLEYPLDPHPRIGSKLLDQYIATHYRREATFGSYSILSEIAASPR